MKYITIVFIMILTVCLTSDTFAGVDRLKDGAKQLVTAPIHIATDPVQTVDNYPDQKIFALIGGIADGALHAAHDMVFGLFKVLTFPVEGGC